MDRETQIIFPENICPAIEEEGDNCYNESYTLETFAEMRERTMYFDDPIYLDPGSFEDLMVDTDQHRICWMYHDILSHPRIAWMFDKYAGKGTPIREAWTTMAWVAAGCQEDSFYLLFKWYEDFYGPPQRSDLYFLEREGGLEGDLRVRCLNRDFQHKLPPRDQEWFDSFLGRVSSNASYFFGESSFQADPIGRARRLLENNPGRELECFDWHLGRRSDGEKCLMCATMSAYFHSIQAVREILFRLVDSDGQVGRGSHHMPADELVDILRSLSAKVDEERLPGLEEQFQELADGFYDEPCLSPHLSRSTGRVLSDMTENGELRWMNLSGKSASRLLRDLYSRCAPRQMWDVFHRWQGEVYFTVLRRPLTRELHRGVYLLSRFEDQTGLDVTGMFWLENVSVGVAHLCQGEFFEELLDLIFSRYPMQGKLPPVRPWGQDLVGEYSHLLKETFAQYSRGFG